MKKLLWMFVVLAAAFSVPLNAMAAPKIRVVATMSIFADLVKRIGGDHVEVHTVASPRFNIHFIEPKPSDVLRVSKADILAHGGLDLEAWRAPLVEASANPKILPGGSGDLDLSQGIPLFEVPTQPLSRAQGDIHMYGNPHYWLDPNNGRTVAQNIARKLMEVDPEHRGEYQTNLNNFLKELDAKLPVWKAKLAGVRGKEAIAYHNEWVYLAEFAGIKIDQFLEPKPGIPPTPRHLAFLEKYIREHKIPAIFQASFYSKDAGRALEKRTGITMVLLCQNVGEIKEAGDFFSFFDYNVDALAHALGNKK